MSVQVLMGDSRESSEFFQTPFLRDLGPPVRPLRGIQSRCVVVGCRVRDNCGPNAGGGRGHRNQTCIAVAGCSNEHLGIL